MSIDTWTPAAPVGNANHESDNVVKMDEWTNDMANGTVGADQSTQPDGLKGWYITEPLIGDRALADTV